MSSPPRLKAGLRVSAVLRLAAQRGLSAMRLRKGDEDAGSLILILRHRDGRAVVVSEMRDAEGESGWIRITGDEPVDDEAVSACVDRQTERDPDLWVLEIETTDFSAPFGEKIL